MPECRVIPCYKLFLKDLTEILSSSPLNLPISPLPQTDISPAIDVEHITIPNTRYNLPSTIEAVNRGVQTNFRFDTKKDSPIFGSKMFNNRQVVS